MSDKDVSGGSGSRTTEPEGSITQWVCSSRCWQEGGPHDANCYAIRYVPEARCVRAEEALRQDWRLVERYCESFKDDDFRLVFKKGEGLTALINEISVSKEVSDSFGVAVVSPESRVNISEQHH